MYHISNLFIIIVIAIGMIVFYLYREELFIIKKAKSVDLQHSAWYDYTNKYLRKMRIPALDRVYQGAFEEPLIAVLLFIFFIYGTALRFYNLDYQEFFQDEWWHVSVVKSLSEGGGFQLWNYVSDQPMAAYGNQIFNWIIFNFQLLLGDSETALRFFPALMGSLTIPLIYFAFKDFLGKEVSLLTAIMFSFNIITIFLSKFLRPYTFFLFLYILIFYLIYRLYLFSGSTTRKVGLSLLILILTLIAFDSREQAKIIVMNVAVFCAAILFPIFWARSRARNRNIVFCILILLFGIATFAYLGLLDLSALIKMASNNFSLYKLFNPTIEYYSYIFELNMKNPVLNFIFFGLGIFSLALKSFDRMGKKHLYFLCWMLPPFLIMIFLFDRYEDFRYIYFVIPFVQGCIMLGFYNIIRIYSRALTTQVRLITSIYLLLLIIIYPVTIGMDDSILTIKGPSDWQDSDGATHLHRRCVAPEYEMAFNYVASNIEPPYALVVTDGYVKYLDKFEGNPVYYQNPFIGDNFFHKWNNLTPDNYRVVFSSAENASLNSTVTLGELIKRYDKIVFIYPYMHMIDQNIFDFLYYDTKNLAKVAGIKRFNYTTYYEQYDFYWPNIFYWERKPL